MKKLLLMFTCLVIVGCTEPEPSSGQKVSERQAGKPTKDAAISWYQGSIESAFAEAAEQDRPIFLYWGAVWCPPCQEIKHTVFKSQEFINLTTLFIPVYLDGDTERAQTWGDRFGVMGYPTMIVFNPAGEELTRLPGNIDISRYNSVLELSLNQMKPMSNIIMAALADPSQLSEADFRQLAYYSWFQDVSALPEDADREAFFHALSSQVADDELSTRFFMLYLLARLDREGAVISNDQVERLQFILTSDELTLAAWDTLAYECEEILALVPEGQRAVVAEQWWRRAFSLRFAEPLSKAEKLAGWFPRLYLLTKDGATLGEDVRQQIKKELAVVDRATPDSFERQSVVNQMGHVYRRAGMMEQAKSLLVSELERSASPYYFMSTLGHIAEQEEGFAEALTWRGEAYRTAVGEATRFQWGTEYVLAMIRMAPEQERQIVDQAVALLKEFDDQGQLLAGRNFTRLRQLSDELGKWRQSRPTVTPAFTAEVQALCRAQDAGSQEAENCRELISDSDLAAVI